MKHSHLKQIIKEGNWKNEIYKGCSSFEISGLHEFEDVLEDGYAYGITKETCKGDDCNIGTSLNSQTQKFLT